MHLRSTGPAVVLTVITGALGILLASLLTVIGVASLISPDVPSAYLAQNTRVCVMLLCTAAVVGYALFRPLWGGIALCACGAVFVYLIPNPIAAPVLLVAVLSVIRALISRPTGAWASRQGS